MIFFILRAHFPWSYDSKCADVSTTFSTDKILPSVGLISFPNSGNTWTRYLIEGVTGVFTGSFYYGICNVLAGKINYYRF